LENSYYLAHEYTISFTGHKIKHYQVNTLPELFTLLGCCTTSQKCEELNHTAAQAYISEIHYHHESDFLHTYNQLLTLKKNKNTESTIQSDITGYFWSYTLLMSEAFSGKSKPSEITYVNSPRKHGSGPQQSRNKYRVASKSYLCHLPMMELFEKHEWGHNKCIQS
jgi:hypothetical protein